MIENRSVPSASVIPELAYPDVREAAAWLCRAFGFQERLRIGDHRAQLILGDGAVVVTALTAEQEPSAPAGHALLVRVDDLDAHHQRARSAGARILQEPADFPYGERQYTAEDPVGRRWTFSQSIANVDPASWGGEVAEPS